MKVQFIGLVHGEAVSYACASCGGGLLRRGKRLGNTLLLRAKPHPTLTSQTRIIVAASYPAQIGRFKVYSFRPGVERLPVLASGCLAPGVTTVNASEAKHLSLLHTVACPAPPLNPIGAEFVFWRGTSGQLWEKRYNGRTWTNAGGLDEGRVASSPAVAVHANGEQDVFWRGNNGHLWEAWFRGAWNGPIELGGGKLASSPTAGVDSAGDEYVFWKDTNGGLSWTRYAHGGWSVPRQAGVGELGSGPAVAVHPDGEQDVFWKGVNGKLTEAYCLRADCSNGGWHGPTEPVGGGQLGSAPAVATDGANNEYVFWEGTDQHLWSASYGVGGWNSVAPLNGGRLGSPPTVAVHADGQQDVFWRGRDGHLWETWFIKHWYGPINLHARVTSAPAVGLDASGKQGAQ